MVVKILEGRCKLKVGQSEGNCLSTLKSVESVSGREGKGMKPTTMN